MDSLPRYIIATSDLDDATDTFVEVFRESEGDGSVELPSGAMVLYGVQSVQIGDVTLIFRAIPDNIGPVTPPLRWGQVTAQPNLNVRYEPGGDWIGRLPFGTRVPLLEERDGWYQIPLDEIGGHGWVSGRYITEISEGD